MKKRLKEKRTGGDFRQWNGGQREEFLSLILEQKVKILKILPNDTVRIADESSLIITDIVIEIKYGCSDGASSGVCLHSA